MRHGGQILVDQLCEEGCDMAFCVPGESFLAALDGLYGQNDIRTIICRQEGGAAMMAEAYGKMTGRPGVAFVTRGPGATNASIGVHIARQDSSPMILFVGQARRGVLNREAFQEVDFPAMFAPLAKWSAEISDTSRIPEFVSRAVHTAMAGRPGPVVLSLPEDMLRATEKVAHIPVSPIAEPYPGDKDMKAVGEALAQAKRPLVFTGKSGWSKQVRDNVGSFAEAWDLPVIAMFRAQDCMDNNHPNYAGFTGLGTDPALVKRFAEADLILAIGPRLGEMSTVGYTLLTPPAPKQRLIHVHPATEELGSVYRADIPVNCSLNAFAARLPELKPPKSIPWSDWTKSARADYEAFSTLQTQTPGDVKLEQVIAHVSETVPDDAIIANGAGNYSGFVHRFTRYRDHRSQLANTAGAMGYGLPASIGGKLAAPKRSVICYQGDGCFLMNGQELATAVRYDLPIVIIVVNNGMYGTIRMHQEREYPGRVSGTDLVNPDFAAYARSFGAKGETVLKTDDFPDVFREALKAKKPTLIELKVDPEAISPKLTLSEIRAAAEAKS